MKRWTISWPSTSFGAHSPICQVRLVKLGILRLYQLTCRGLILIMLIGTLSTTLIIIRISIYTPSSTMSAYFIIMAARQRAGQAAQWPRGSA